MTTSEKGEKLSKYWTPDEPSPIREKGLENWIEEQILEAMAQGKFRDLPGKGKPLQLGPEHPWEQTDWMANHVLANAKVLPEWVELEQQINEELLWLKANRPDHPDRPGRIETVNRLIDRFNFVVPLGSMQRARYRE